MIFSFFCNVHTSFSYQVGVDNMCILVHAVKRQKEDLNLEVRISNALGDVGPSITLSSLCEVLAFAVGGFISMPACRIFSIFAGEQAPLCSAYRLLVIFITFERWVMLNLLLSWPLS